jgi:hypothetical protein
VAVTAAQVAEITQVYLDCSDGIGFEVVRIDGSKFFLKGRQDNALSLSIYWLLAQSVD